MRPLDPTPVVRFAMMAPVIAQNMDTPYQKATSVTCHYRANIMILTSKEQPHEAKACFLGSSDRVSRESSAAPIKIDESSSTLSTLNISNRGPKPDIIGQM